MVMLALFTAHKERAHTVCVAVSLWLASLLLERNDY